MLDMLSNNRLELYLASLFLSALELLLSNNGGIRVSGLQLEGRPSDLHTSLMLSIRSAFLELGTTSYWMSSLDRLLDLFMSTGLLLPGPAVNLVRFLDISSIRSCLLSGFTHLPIVMTSLIFSLSTFKGLFLLTWMALFEMSSKGLFTISTTYFSTTFLGRGFISILMGTMSISFTRLITNSADVWGRELLSLCRANCFVFKRENWLLIQPPMILALSCF